MGAQFRDNIADFVAREVVDACAPQGVAESGGGSDSMTLAVARRQDELGVLEAVGETRPPFSPEAAVAESSPWCCAPTECEK
jgi:hypothetical protein